MSSQDVLAAASRRELPIDHPVHEHLIKYSPCYQEFRAPQQAGPVQSPVSAATRPCWLAAAAAVGLAAVAGAWFFFAADRAAYRPDETGARGADRRIAHGTRSPQVHRGTERAVAERTAAAFAATWAIEFDDSSAGGVGARGVRGAGSRFRATVESFSDGRGQIRDFVTTLQPRMDLSCRRPVRTTLQSAGTLASGSSSSNGEVDLAKRER